MKKSIKKILIKLFRPIAHKLGYSAKDSLGTNSLLNLFYTNLKSFGFNPVHIVDIGANHGRWTREALKHFPDAYYTLLEPQYWLKSSIEDLLNTNKKINFNGVGAGASAGSFKFTIHDKDHSCSFKFTEEEAHQRGFKQVDLQVVTLNELLADNKLPTPDIIKIDAEGWDIEVLKGASIFLGKTEIFMVEVAISCKHFDNTILKMMNFMNEAGYTFFDITDLNRPIEPKVLWLAELVFIKKNGFLDSKIPRRFRTEQTSMAGHSLVK
ncbi:FkbM family methyltransferase [Segetibacter koreensis]|uniref:FkbM family methyltransferase n=1 Tax=Segetibacter koreensis TaxID=398037 RepID=UPI00037ADB44|nr:FkbM family methyltransferase [Segetibacter koreensis]